VVIVSPDAGGVERARIYSKMLECSLAIIDKRRESPNVSQVLHLIGDVAGKRAILVDDIIDTAGTLCNAASAVLQHGATEVYAVATHGVLLGPAIERINKSVIKRIWVTNSIPQEDRLARCDRLTVVSLGPAAGRGGQAHPPRRLHLEPVLLSRSADNDLCLTGGEAQSCGYPPGGTTREEEKRQ
jgi:ribose-phosphate pyrophosphokinase